MSRLRKILRAIKEHLESVGADLNSDLIPRRRRSDLQEQYEDMLASIWLYIDWRYVTKQLTTEQKNLFADSIDRAHARQEPFPIGPPEGVTRWWDPDYYPPELDALEEDLRRAMGHLKAGSPLYDPARARSMGVHLAKAADTQMKWARQDGNEKVAKMYEHFKLQVGVWIFEVDPTTFRKG